MAAGLVCCGFSMWACLEPRVVLAGMPVITLSEFAQLRFQTISFFLVVVLASAWGVLKLWNSLGRDFVQLPQLTYPTALSIVLLWGMLFIIVLTMISGARELMTPGAWEKQGLTYKLREPYPRAPSEPASAAPADEQPLDSARQEQLRGLYAELLKSAAPNEGSFSLTTGASDAPSAAWEVPGAFGAKYLYVPGRSIRNGNVLLAYEPELFGKTRYALFANGEIRRLTTDEILRTLAAEKLP